MFRATIARNARLFSTNARLQKTATEQVKETLETVNRKVSDALGSAIDAGGESAVLYIPSIRRCRQTTRAFSELVLAANNAARAQIFRDWF